MEKPLKILIVEDNPEELEYAKSIVELVNSLTPEERALRIFDAYAYYNYFTDEGIKLLESDARETAKKEGKVFDELRFKEHINELRIRNSDYQRHAPKYSGYFLEPTYATDLTQALRELNKKSGLTAVLSDVFYPLGQKPANKEELFRILGEGLYEVSSMGEGLYGIDSSRRRPEYYREQLAKGQVSEGDVPSGVVLALCALKQNVPSVLITSEFHHGPKTEAINELHTSRSRSILSYFIDGTYGVTGRKRWENTFSESYKIAHRNLDSHNTIAEEEDNRQKAISDRRLNYLKPNLVALLSLPENINRYLTL